MVKKLNVVISSDFKSKALGRYSEHSSKRTENCYKILRWEEFEQKHSLFCSIIIITMEKQAVPYVTMLCVTLPPEDFILIA